MDELEQYLAEHETPQTAVSTHSLRELAYERLKDAIRYADLQPGDPLSENRLSKLLGISRTPVREALRQLAQEGLVQIIPGRAVTVAAPSVREVLNVVHVRSLLEPELTRLVAGSISPEELDRLYKVLDRMDSAAQEDDRTAWSKADTVFHEILCQESPNALLGATVLQMRNRIHHLAIDAPTTQDRIIECTAEHRQIVQAIAARDPVAAEKSTRKHIERLRESMFNRLAYS